MLQQENFPAKYIDNDHGLILPIEKFIQKGMSLDIDRRLIFLARRNDCDDIACFGVGKGNRIQIVHDYVNARYEQSKE